MHNEAGERFQRLLTNEVPTGVRNRAWFYLAQIWYARGYLDKADAALRKINGRMSATLEAQKELLFANVLMREGKMRRGDPAALGLARRTGTWSAYARFNLGVALVRSKRLNDADPFLSGVGTMLATTARAGRTARQGEPGAGLCLPAGGRAGARASGARARAPERTVFEQGAARHRLGGCRARRLPGRADALDGAARPQPARRCGAGVLPRRAVCLQQAERQRAVGRLLRERGQVLRCRERSPRCGHRPHPPGRHARRTCWRAMRRRMPARWRRTAGSGS